MAHKRSMGLGGITNLSLIAPVKPGMVDGFEPISYLERLRKVLDALHSSRQNVRESELVPPVFPDSVGRFGIVHHFRYAILPPFKGSSLSHLSLNVTFDGGWEPYMRVIHRDLGPLLDLLFCHCDGYPGSDRSFEVYCEWVRSSEVESGLFYADSPMPLGDHEYLARFERAQREGASDADLTRLAVPSAAARWNKALQHATDPKRNALVLPLRTLKGLYRLSVYFPAKTAERDDADVLRRFAHDVLKGPVEVMNGLEGLPEDHPAKQGWIEARRQFKDELAWFDLGYRPPKPQTPEVAFNPAHVQSHLRAGNGQATHACLALYRVSSPAQARQTLAALATRCADLADDRIGYTVAFTYGGLAALEMAPERLERLPQEFVDGMEARCALLGDLRGNHPDRWTRPQAASGGYRIDLRAVHVVLHLRLSDPQNASPQLHARLHAAALTEQASGGLTLLAVEPMFAQGKGTGGGHFQFADGISQPHNEQLLGASPHPKAVKHSDDVPLGELVLGHENGRGDVAHTGIDPLLRDGSFLVVRKLRQRLDHVDSVLPARGRKELMAKMFGRNQDGTPLSPLPAGRGPNDFDYEDAAASDACPFHSHVRRANPRDKRFYTPRILRRGMSYGAKDDVNGDVGVVFMAYCASIAEQFETIQRWLAGGSSSGVGSAQPDPVLRVPQQGEPYTFRYLDAAQQVQRVKLGDDKALVELQWGLYLFVPSVVALGVLGTFAGAAPAEAARAGAQAEPPQLPGDEADLEHWRPLLEDDEKAEAVWAVLRSRGQPQTNYGRLVGRRSDVLDVLRDAQGYSVCGYADRMEKSVGLNLLGLDEGSERTRQLGLSAAIESISQADAFDAALPIAAKWLADIAPLPGTDRRPVDLVAFGDAVMAQLCQHWIGLPDGQYMVAGGRQDVVPGLPRCPGNLATASRYIFTPHPRPALQDAGQRQGTQVQEKVREWLAAGPRLGLLAQRIKDELAARAQSETEPSARQPHAADLLALSLAGVLLAFPPTVQGNFLRVMEHWIRQETLWLHQNTVRAGGLDFASVSGALHQVLATAMRRRPVPDTLWRTPAGVDPEVDHSRVILSIASALRDGGPDELVFGRDNANPTIHGCPGYEMAMGVLLGMLAGLLSAGTLRPTGSPVLLILTPG